MIAEGVSESRALLGESLRNMNVEAFCLWRHIYTRSLCYLLEFVRTLGSSLSLPARYDHSRLDESTASNAL